MAGSFGTEFTRTQTPAAVEAAPKGEDQTSRVAALAPGAARAARPAITLGGGPITLGGGPIGSKGPIGGSGAITLGGPGVITLGSRSVAPAPADDANCPESISEFFQELSDGAMDAQRAQNFLDKQEREFAAAKIALESEHSRNMKEMEEMYAALDKVIQGLPVTDEEWDSIPDDMKEAFTRPRG